jgi:methionine-rich copper-binding protein CopC
MSSIRLNGNGVTGAYFAYDDKSVANGILSAAGLMYSESGSFSGSAPLVTFEYTQSSLAPVNFAVTKESFNGVSYLSGSTSGNILQVALNSAGQSVTPPPIDTIAPTITAYTPAAGSTLTGLESNLTLTFSESVQKGTGTIQLRSGSATGALVESFDVASSNRLSLSGATLTVDPTASLLGSTTYYLVLTSGSLKDITGNAFAGTSGYSFTTSSTSAVDTTPPTLSAWSPAQGSTLSALDSNLVATFSETVSKRSGTLELHTGSANGPLVESFNLATSTRVSANGSTLSVDPTANLMPSTTYVVVLPSGGVQDTALNALGGAATLTFQTSATPSVPPPTTPTVIGNSTLVAATDAEKLGATQLKSYFPSVASDAVTQSKLGPSLVLSADLPNETSQTKIMAGRTSAASGVLDDKATAMSVALPSQVGLDISGPTYATTVADGKNYFTGLVEGLFPSATASPSDRAYKGSLLAGIESIKNYSSPSDLSAVRLFSPAGNAGLQAVAIKGSATVNDLAVVNMHGLSNSSGVQIEQLSSVMAAGSGTVTVVGEQPSTVVGDMFNQTIVGGSGNDTIGGGGGNDVLFGGAGQDTFLLGSSGQVTVGDYTPGDVMKFNVFGVNSLAQLAASVTRASENSQGVTFTIGADLTVTLTGLSLNSNYTDAMFAFGA